PLPSPRAAGEGPGVEIEEQDVPLFEALRAHRAALAKEKALPAYIIAHDRTLREIARIRPTSLDDLALARGMGQAKISSYGEGILRVVREFSGP
ncbi:HRDC domain-containing protein, partial [Sorangium cellulosum]|uniref:HRDC domain-containing protein n=1 Tax=Sorangium cellulosum TaxID=56 RepID=UPI000ADAA26B